MNLQWNFVYGVACLSLSKKALNLLEKCQSKLLKTALGLKAYCRNTPLFKAINIKCISQTINENQRDILKSCMRTDSKGLQFYAYILCRKVFMMKIILLEELP